MCMRIAVLALLGTLSLTACADRSAPTTLDLDPPLYAVSPSLTTTASRPSSTALSSDLTTGNHLVVFKGAGVPAGFADRVAALGGRVELALDPLGAATVSGLSAKGVEALLRGGGIQTVEAEGLILLDDPVPPFPMAEESGAGAPDSPGDPAAAYFFPRQWNLRAIHADAAWAAGGVGSSDVTVAILDSGIGYSHADLMGRVDLSRSVSFLPEEDAWVEALFPGAHPIADLGYHGTHVAAIVSSNAYAAAGVTSQVTLLGVKVCYGAAGSGCPWGAILGGLLYAADAGADVVNMSLGGGFLKTDYPGFLSVINRAVLYLNRVGVTVVVSAGNSGLDLDRYPNLYKTYCDTPNTMCVSATGPTAQGSVNGPWTDVDALADYSNFGRSAIDVAAPGGNGDTFVWSACSPFSLVIPVCQTGTYVVGLMGTSMAVPHVSGVAALAVEAFGRSPDRVKAWLRQTADDLGQPGTDKAYGKGRINAYSAVRR